MSITIGGLASGIDTDALVAGLVAAASRPGDLLEAQQATLESRQSAYATLSSRLTTLQEALQAIDAVDEFRAVQATSTNDDAVGVTAEGDAVVGAFTVQVNALAAASLHVSQGFADRDDDTLGATGTLVITVGAAAAVTVTLDASHASLDDIVSAINDQVAGVTAYIMDTGDATTPYRLVIAADATGTVNDLVVDTSGLTAVPTTGAVPTMVEVTNAADASIEVNGVVVTHSDNDIEGVIQGVTIHAYATTATDAQITAGTGSLERVTVTRDEDAMVEAIQSIVTAWNAVTMHIATQRSWNPDENIRGHFIGESVPRQVTQQLQSAVATSYGSGEITALSQLGISTNQDGELELDEDALRDALSANFENVVALFTDAAPDGVNAALQAVIDGFIDEDDGSVEGRVDGLGDQIETMQARIAAFNERMEAYEERLRSQFTQMEIIMSRLDSSMSILEAFAASASSNNN